MQISNVRLDSTPGGFDWPNSSFEKGRTHSVLAVEFTSEPPHIFYWIIGPGFVEREQAGITYPDVIPATKCELFDSNVPSDWALAVHYYPSGVRAILGPREFSSRGYLETLVDGDVETSRAFRKALEKYYPAK